MKFPFIYILVPILLGSCIQTDTQFKRNQSFNSNWKFLNGDIDNVESCDFNDSQWRIVDLPHDISVEDLNIQDSLRIGPFTIEMENGIDVGFLSGGTAWYRKHFVVESGDAGKEFLLNFDGVQSETTVYVNGRKAAEHKYGYTAFNVNLTPYLAEVGEENVIAVKVINPEVSSRWFAGFGIYRNVTLSVLHRVHIKDWGVFVTTPEISKNKAKVNLDIELVNTIQEEGSILVNVDILDPNKTLLSTLQKEIKLSAIRETSTSMEMSVSNPMLWDTEFPNLYSAVVKLIRNKKTIDTYEINFGIRSIEFSAEKGFLLNGQNVLLKGACLHHDNGLLGAAAFKMAEYRRVEIMKRNGFNAIRTSHNPPSTYFLDACDLLGMLVIDEAFDMWELEKRKNDYHLSFNEAWEADLASMLLRDRNHPCIIMWSYGNEVKERARPRGIEIAQMLAGKIKSIDSTRPTTKAICDFWDNEDQNWEEHTPPAFDVMDVAAYNYRWDKYISDHLLYPGRIMYGSESFPKEAFENWDLVEKNKHVIGDFVWTGMDYIGESGIGRSEYRTTVKDELKGLPEWPWYISWCGDIDILGNKKPQSLYRDVVWGESDLEILVHEPIPVRKYERVSAWGWPKEFNHWNWDGNEGEILRVNVYSSYPKIRLELNGKLIGEQEINPDSGITATFNVPYQSGTLKAIGSGKNNTDESKILKTTGEASQIKLTSEHKTVKAGRGEILYVSLSMVDNDNNIVKTDFSPIECEVSGAGHLIAAGSSNPLAESSFQDTIFNVFNGNGLIIIRSNGEKGNIMLNVKSKNGLSSHLEIEAVEYN